LNLRSQAIRVIDEHNLDAAPKLGEHAEFSFTAGCFEGFETYELDHSGETNMGRLAIGARVISFSRGEELWIPVGGTTVHDTIEAVEAVPNIAEITDIAVQDVLDIVRLSELCGKLRPNPEMLKDLSGYLQYYLTPSDSLRAVYSDFSMFITDKDSGTVVWERPSRHPVTERSWFGVETFSTDRGPYVFLTITTQQGDFRRRIPIVPEHGFERV
jgi:hypothetical protein